MSMTPTCRRMRTACAALLTVPFCIAPAMAQQDASPDDEYIEEIVITGSRIPRAGFDTLVPALVIDSEFLEDRSFTDIGSALNELPAFGAAGNNFQNGTNEQSAQSVGQVFVDFFGIGSQRTLTLVNGRRFVSSNTPATSSTSLVTTTSGLQVDMNNIPIALIDRVETIAVGGAPIYGADAIAGTVNVIMKQNFEGFNIRSNYGISDASEMEETSFSVAWGANSDDGKGNVVLAFEHSDRAGMIQADMPHLARGWQFRDTGDPNFTNTLIAPGKASIVSSGGVITPTDFLLPNVGSGGFADGSFLQFAPDGTVVPYDIGTAVNNAVWSIGGEGLFLPDVSALASPIKRTLVTAMAHYEIAPGVEVFGEAWVGESSARELIRQPSYQSGLFGFEEFALQFAIDNPQLTPAAQATLAGLTHDDDGDPLTAPVPITDFWIHRSSTDMSINNDVTTADNNLLRLVGGFRGDFLMGDRVVDWEVSYNRGKSTGTSQFAEIDNRRFFYALDVIDDPANPGTLGCRVTLDPTSRPADPAGGFGTSLPPTADYSACVPLNLFGAGAPSQEAVEYISVTELARSILEQNVVSANANTDLFELPAGSLGIAFGVERREEKGAFENSAFMQLGLGRNDATAPISGKYVSEEVYAEFYAPIFSPDMDIPLVDNLSIEGAWRTMDNDFAGKDDAWTIGLRYSPIEDIEFRGNVTRSVRAPSIQELFLPVTGTSSFANDPCHFEEVDGGPNPAIRRANCIAGGGGLPPIPDPDNFTSSVGNASVNGKQGGNIGLKNEGADSWTAGVILRPRWVEGLMVSVDYVDIDIEEAIEAFSLTQIMRGCYDAASFPNTLCDSFSREADGQLPANGAFQVGFVNAGQRTFQAYTIEALYSMELWNGQLDFGGSMINIKENKTVVLGSPDEDAGEIGSPDWQANLTFRYSRDKWSALLQPRMIGDGVRSLDDAPGRYSVAKEDTVWIVNGAFRYSFTDTIDAQFNINNMFDELPSAHVIAWGLDNVYDNVGRFYRLGFSIRM
jgi:iron complex outermembrane receptor protein